MRARHPRPSSALRLALVLLTTTGLAGGVEPAAEIKKQCAAAHSDAQNLKLEGKLIAAREKLVSCSADQCPAVVRKECSEMLPEIDRLVPSIVVVARDPAGNDTTSVSVLLDGHPLLPNLDGKAHSVDPGPHKLRFELAGARVVEREVLIREGEKARTIEVKFESDAPVAPSSSVSASPAEPPGPARRPVPVSVWALGGTGALALGAFGYFALSGRSQESDLRDRGCEPYCPKSETDEVKQKYLLGDIFLAVGLVSLGTASYLYLKRPAAKEEKASVVRWNAGALRGGGFASIEGAF